MPDSVHDVVKSLLDSKILQEQDLPGNLDPSSVEDVEQLTADLMRRRKLTAYQCQAIRNGRTTDLVIGQYVLLDKIGEGGMGQVYKAQHRQTDAIVALKVLPETNAESEEAVKRFQREMQVSAILHHPNIVMSHDMGEVSGVRYLAMEYVDGIDLSTHVKMDGPVSSHRATDFIVQAARGLAHAHQEGIIHRDIKPSNLLLDRRGLVKILDMGLAKFADDVDGLEELGNERLTMQDQMMGTVDYMSPEQAMDTHNANTLSDIYSLGCTLYFVLTGEPMYEGDTSIAKLMAPMEPPIPSLRDKVPDATEKLDATYQRMVAKQPEDRHSTMADVIADLEACLEEFGGPLYSQQVAAAPQSATSQPAAPEAQPEEMRRPEPEPAPKPPAAESSQPTTQRPQTSARAADAPAERKPHEARPAADSSIRPSRPSPPQPRERQASEGGGSFDLPSVIYPPSMTEELRKRAEESQAQKQQDQPLAPPPQKDESPSVISPRPRHADPAAKQPEPPKADVPDEVRKTVFESKRPTDSSATSPQAEAQPKPPSGGLGSSEKTVVTTKTTVVPRSKLNAGKPTDGGSPSAPSPTSTAGRSGFGSLAGKLFQALLFLVGVAIIVALAVQFARGLLQ